MGRSVSVPSSAEAVAYTTFEYDGNDDDGYFAEEAFNDNVEYLTELLQEAFPSLYEDEEWVGREDRAFLANRFARIGLSEYCGLVAVWAIPKEDGYGNVNALGANWAAKTQAKLDEIAGKAFGVALVKVGTFSNGEAIFRAANPAETKGDMGLGFTSKEGWL